MSAPDYAPSSPKILLALRGASAHVQSFSHIWLERRPALAQAVMAPLICWSFSSSMFK